MADIPVVDAQGKAKGTHSACDAVFATEVKPHVVRLAINAILANRRQGNASVKTRNTVSGGGRKPFKQKGTGRARQGTSRAPHMRGGAIVHGPSPKSWRQRVNKKVRRQAMTSVLSSHLTENSLRAIDDFKINDPKTREFSSLLDRLDLNTSKVLVLLKEQTPQEKKDGVLENVQLSARNLPNVTITSTNEVNVYDLVLCDQVLTTVDAIQAIESRFGDEEAK